MLFASLIIRPFPWQLETFRIAINFFETHTLRGKLLGSELECTGLEARSQKAPLPPRRNVTSWKSKIVCSLSASRPPFFGSFSSTAAPNDARIILLIDFPFICLRWNSFRSLRSSYLILLCVVNFNFVDSFLPLRRLCIYKCVIFIL